MIIEERNQFNHSFITKSLKSYRSKIHILQRIYVAKFQINENFTRDPIIFVHYFDEPV